MRAHCVHTAIQFFHELYWSSNLPWHYFQTFPIQTPCLGIYHPACLKACSITFHSSDSDPVSAGVFPEKNCQETSFSLFGYVQRVKEAHLAVYPCNTNSHMRFRLSLFLGNIVHAYSMRHSYFKKKIAPHTLLEECDLWLSLGEQGIPSVATTKCTQKRKFTIN